LSGHSKWSTIKRQKGAADAKRGVLFTKLTNAITLAVREKGEKNPNLNFKLRLAVERARAANMPNENIDRAIKRGAGEIEGITIESVIYEGFGPGGSALIIEALTDNRNRTSNEIRSILTKYGGQLGAPKSVMWQFKQAGVIYLKDAQNIGWEELEAKIIEAGADDIKKTSEGIEIFSSPANLKSVSENLINKGIKLESAELIYQPVNSISPNEKEITKLNQLIEELETNQDVTAVYTNIKQ